MPDTQPFGLVQQGGELVQAADVSPVVDPLLGVTIGEFTVDAFLAQGGMGRVYRATHRSLPSLRRAVKVLLDTTRESDHAAFKKEAAAASEVKSINIAALHDFGFLPEGAPYIMMELLLGRTLEAHLKELRIMPSLEALALAQQVLAALSAIHAAGLVHRDIKPANLFLVNDASHGVVVKVMDLGLAAARPNVCQETGVGTEKEANRAGTPVYASPEQFGDLVVGPASDVYSLGVVLYELVTGQVPFLERPGESETSLPRRHINEKPKRPGLVVTDLPSEIEAFMLSLLEKEPINRPSVAAAQNQVKRLREKFRDQVREGPTQIKANPLEPSIRNTDQLPLQTSTKEALAGIRSGKKTMLAGGIIAVLILLGFGIAMRMQLGERLKPVVPTPTEAPQIEKADLAGLPSAPAARVAAPSHAKASAPVAGVRRTRTLATPLGPCSFDAAVVQYAQEERSNLLRRPSASLPAFKMAENALDTGLLERDCRKVQMALESLRRAAGVRTEE